MVPVCKRRRERGESAGLGRARACRALQAILFPQGKRVTMVAVWRMDSRMNKEGLYIQGFSLQISQRTSPVQEVQSEFLSILQA